MIFAALIPHPGCVAIVHKEDLGNVIITQKWTFHVYQHKVNQNETNQNISSTGEEIKHSILCRSGFDCAGLWNCCYSYTSYVMLWSRGLILPQSLGLS